MSNAGVTVPSALTRWFEAFKQDVLEGRVSLEDLLAAADADMQAESVDLCPSCSRVLRRGEGYKDGLCAVCHLNRLRDAHYEELAKLVAIREYNVAKQQLKRLRRRMGVEAPRAPKGKVAEDYGFVFMLPTEEPLPFVTCGICGEPFRLHTDSNATVCPECRERALQRAERKGAGQ